MRNPKSNESFHKVFWVLNRFSVDLGHSNAPTGDDSILPYSLKQAVVSHMKLKLIFPFPFPQQSTVVGCTT